MSAYFTVLSDCNSPSSHPLSSPPRDTLVLTGLTSPTAWRYHINSILRLAVKSRHGAQACVRAVLDIACPKASQDLSMALTVLSPMGFLVQRQGPGVRHGFAMKYMGGPNWLGLERDLGHSPKNVEGE